VVNRLWGQRGEAFEPAFLDVLGRNYGADLRLMDFRGQAEASRVAINRWVAERTAERIRDLLPADSVGRDTVLVLTNAMYFTGAWAVPFKAAYTKEGAFHLLDGGEVQVPLMMRRASLSYGRGSGWEAVQLPYAGERLAMLLIVPEGGRFAEVERSLDAAMLAGGTKGLRQQDVLLKMPRFTARSAFSLRDTLAGMGMPIAFSNGADFSGMNGKRDLLISGVYHQAFVAVDEQGTEAAAATGVAVAKAGVPAKPVELIVDRPFVFLIRDVQTGAVVFMGRLTDPRP
jgi:serpin B